MFKSVCYTGSLQPPQEPFSRCGCRGWAICWRSLESAGDRMEQGTKVTLEPRPGLSFFDPQALCLQKGPPTDILYCCKQESRRWGACVQEALNDPSCSLITNRNLSRKEAQIFRLRILWKTCTLLESCLLRPFPEIVLLIPCRCSTPPSIGRSRSRIFSKSILSLSHEEKTLSPLL